MEPAVGENSPLIMLFLAVLFLTSAANTQHVLRIGGLLHTPEDVRAFHVATTAANRRFPSLRLQPITHLIPAHDTFSAYNLTCAFLRQGVAAVFGPSSASASASVQSLLDRKEVPHVETHYDRRLRRHDCLLNVHPHPSALSSAFLGVVYLWGWTRLAVLYDSEVALERAGLAATTFNGQVTLWRLVADEGGGYREALTEAKIAGECNFIVVCETKVLGAVLVQAQQVGMMTERHGYVLANLDLQTVDLGPFQYSGANITGFRVVNPEDQYLIEVAEEIYGMDTYHKLPPGWRIKLETVLIMDAVELFHQAISDLILREKIVIRTHSLPCNGRNNWNSGHTIVNYMKGKSILGLSGILHFDNEGFRRDFALDVLELTPGGLLKIGSWLPSIGITINRQRDHQPVVVEEGGLANKTFRIITCLTNPYGMLKETTTRLEGNDRFEGFGIDLIDELSTMLNFNYTIVIQEDGKNGNFDPVRNEWDGLIGSIIAGKADLAIADLTVTAERESAVDFTLQFMNLGISILYKKPKPVPPSLFMFMSPFSSTVWILLLVAYFLTSLCFFVMGRLSPKEWTNPYPCIEEPEYLINQFSIRNSLWFTIGSLMQQGTEIAPIGISTRTASGIWWFFVLIMVSSYTANLAAFLTVETLVTPFNDVEELAEQTEIIYGAKSGGATANFFKNAGNNSVKQKIWDFMSKHEEYMTDDNDKGVEKTENENYAFFMESTTIEYVIERHCSLASVGSPLDDKGYAIAMKKNSSYRNDLSAAILRLQETGRISALKEKWWKEKRGAGQCAPREETAATALDLQNVGGVFLVMFIGIIIGFFLSFVELGAKVYAQTKNRDKFKDAFLKELKFFVRFKEKVKPQLEENK